MATWDTQIFAPVWSASNAAQPTAKSIYSLDYIPQNDAKQKPLAVSQEDHHGPEAQTPAKQEVLSDRGIRFAASLAGKVSFVHTASQCPQILNELGSYRRNSKKCIEVINELLALDQLSREKYSVAVLKELGAAIVYFRRKL